MLLHGIFLVTGIFDLPLNVVGISNFHQEQVVSAQNRRVHVENKVYQVSTNPENLKCKQKLKTLDGVYMIVGYLW